MNKTKIAFGIGIVALFAVLSVSAASAHVTAYFTPAECSVPEGECHSAYVEVWMDVTDPHQVKGGQFAIHYDPSCVNITEHPVALTPDRWGPCIDSSVSSWNVYPECWGPGYDMIMYTFAFAVPHAYCPSPQMIANFTVHCNSSEYCASNLSISCGEYCWACPIEVMDPTGVYLYPDHVTLVDGTFTCGTPEVKFDNVTTADIPVSGTASGDHTYTHEPDDNKYESITEVASKGTSILEHRWTIDVISGTKTNVTFHIEANRTDNDESDDFKFEYWDKSLGEYVTMVTVNTNEDKKYSCKLPNETSGNVTIRVMDTDRGKRHKDLDTISIDHMFIRSVLGPKMPDLVITEKYETLADGTFTVTYTVTNTGDDDAGASTTSITTTAGDSVTDSVPALPASQSYTNTVTGFNCPCGTIVTVTVCADDGNAIVESNEDNNCLSNDLTCPGGELLPDLNITGIWCKEVRKNTYDIYYNITNKGTGNAGESFSNLTVDGTPQKKKDSVDPLGPGDSRIGEKFTYRSTTPPPYTIKVCADYNDIINEGESGETNNCMEVTGVTCPKA